MLYPKEDRLNNTLMFACRTCQFSEPAPSSCVYRNTLYNTVGETAGVTQDVGSDPTVGQPAASAVRDQYGEEEYFDEDRAPFCTLCGNEILCVVCGVEPCGGLEHTTHVPPADAAAGGDNRRRHWDERDEEEEREMKERRISL